MLNIGNSYFKRKYKLNNTYCDGTNIEEANTIIENINNNLIYK